MKKFLLFALVAVVSLLALCSRSQRFQGGNRKLYDTITVYSVDKIVKTFGIGSYLSKNIIIPAGTKIAQMRIVEIPNTELVSGVIKKEENDDKENNDKKRGDNGFNSSGVK